MIGPRALAIGRWLRSRRTAVVAGALAAAFLITIAASAGAQSFDQPDRVLVSTSGSNSEQVKSVPIATAAGQVETVVMSLPFKGQPLLDGDGLTPSSELQVTTDCPDLRDGCVGDPYTYAPQVDTRLILTASDTSTEGAIVAEENGRTCTQEQHHCVIVFPFPDSPSFVGPLASGMRLNVVLSAYDPEADATTDRLIVGENEPGCCGITVQDKGRVNALRLRPDIPGQPRGDVTPYQTASSLVSSVPVRDTVAEGRTVVFSQRLDKLRRHEQLAVSANLTTDISSIAYNRVLINSRLILADSPGATGPGSVVRQEEEWKGEISEANGFNCTQNQPVPEENTNPCQTQKVGVAHLIQSADGRRYVNLVVSATPAKSGPALPGQAVAILDGGLKVVRYPANRYG
jgi:hypothetical protein